MITEAEIRVAFRRFMRGERPTRYRNPKSWYVLDNRSGRLFPLKAIWALANNSPAASFNTSEPIAALKRMSSHFTLVQNVDDEDGSTFQADVRRSLGDDASARRKRLENLPKTPPAYYYTAVKVYIRNSDVVAESLLRAKGVCEECSRDAPFMKASDGTPYLEVHHVNPLASGGYDIVENTKTLCPNCHRKAHYG
jgi:5-methylcytosine-specific restriction protein A